MFKQKGFKNILVFFLSLVVIFSPVLPEVFLGVERVAVAAEEVIVQAPVQASSDNSGDEDGLIDDNVGDGNYGAAGITVSSSPINYVDGGFTLTSSHSFSVSETHTRIINEEGESETYTVGYTVEIESPSPYLMRPGDNTMFTGRDFDFTSLNIQITNIVAPEGFEYSYDLRFQGGTSGGTTSYTSYFPDVTVEFEFSEWVFSENLDRFSKRTSKKNVNTEVLYNNSGPSDSAHVEFKDGDTAYPAYFISQDFNIFSTDTASASTDIFNS